MKRRTETQTGSLCRKRETLSIRNGIVTMAYLINAICPSSPNRVCGKSGLETPPTIYEIGCTLSFKLTNGKIPLSFCFQIDSISLLQQRLVYPKRVLFQASV